MVSRRGAAKSRASSCGRDADVLQTQTDEGGGQSRLQPGGLGHPQRGLGDERDGGPTALGRVGRDDQVAVQLPRLHLTVQPAALGGIDRHQRELALPAGELVRKLGRQPRRDLPPGVDDGQPERPTLGHPLADGGREVESQDTDQTDRGGEEVPLAPDPGQEVTARDQPDDAHQPVAAAGGEGRVAGDIHEDLLQRGPLQGEELHALAGDQHPEDRLRIGLFAQRQTPVVPAGRELPDGQPVQVQPTGRGPHLDHAPHGPVTDVLQPTGEDQASPVDDGDLLAEILHLRHLVARVHQRLPLGLQSEQRVGQELDVEGVQPGERFIQQGQVGLVDDGGEYLHLLLVALAQLFQPAAPAVGDAENLEPVADLPVGLPPLHAEEPREEQQLVAHPHLLVEAAFLREVAEAAPRLLVDGGPAPPDGAPVRTDDVQHQAHSGRLTGPVGAQETEDLSFGDAEGQVVDGDRLSEGLADSLELEHPVPRAMPDRVPRTSARSCSWGTSTASRPCPSR